MPHPLPSLFLHTPLPADISLINFTKLEFSMLETLIPPISFLGPAMIWWLFIMTHDICVWRRLTKKSPLKLTFKQLNIRPVEIQQSHLKLTHPPPTPKLIKIKFQQCFACGLISWIHLVLYCVDYRYQIPPKCLVTSVFFEWPWKCQGCYTIVQKMLNCAISCYSCNFCCFLIYMNLNSGMTYVY